MKKGIILIAVLSTALLCSNALAADEVVIQELQTDVSVTKSKTDKNATDIQNMKGGLPAEAAARAAADAALQEQIDNIQLLPGPQGETGPAGADGTSCTVVQGDGMATITCTDGTVATVNDGTDGAPGEPGTPGQDGKSCTVTQNDGSITISCTDGTTAAVSDGADGAQGPPGADGEQGPPGVNVAAGQSCPTGESVTGFDGDGNIICSGGPPPVDVGVDCGHEVFPNADLHNCDLTGLWLSSYDLSGANLSGANLWGAELSYANLTGANLTGATMIGTGLEHTNLTDAVLTGANLGGARMSFANLTNAVLIASDLSDVYLISADLSNADMYNAILTRVNLSHANLTGANLTSANLEGVIWLDTTCPDGSNSNDNGITCVGFGI